MNKKKIVAATKNNVIKIVFLIIIINLDCLIYFRHLERRPKARVERSLFLLEILRLAQDDAIMDSKFIFLKKIGQGLRAQGLGSCVRGPCPFFDLEFIMAH